MVKELKNQFPMGLLCNSIGISQQLYWLYKNGNIGIREEQEFQIKAKMQEEFDESRQTYGLDRLLPKLRSDGVSIGKNRLSKFMKELDLKPRRKKRFIPKTTNSDHSNPVAKNLLPENESITATNQVWQGDITYIPTQEGWLYLAIVLDSYSRKVVGWSFSNSLATDIVSDAFKMAISRTSHRSADLMFHSDRGVQYTSKQYRDLLAVNKITPSMSRKGNCYDNAKSESFFSTLKNELVHRLEYQTRKEAILSIFEWIEVFYNRKRIHSSIGYQSPVDFENINN
jgi:transposase InsO family protein